MKQITLPANHYAAGWKTEGVVKPLAEITDLGRRYAELPSDSAEKEALLLELCKCFHPYLMKYLVMICRGARAGDRPRGSRRTDQQGHQAVSALLSAEKGVRSIGTP